MSVTGNIVQRGTNVLLSRPLFQSDGVTPILVTSLSACQCALVQKRGTVRTLVLGTDDELRADDAGTGLILELTSAITNELRAGPLTERYKIEFEDLEYIAEPDESIKEVDVQQILIP